MEQQKQKKWKKFQRVSFDRKKAMRRIKRAERGASMHAHKFILKRWRNVREVRRTVAMWSLVVGVLIGATALQLVWNRTDYMSVAGVSGGTYAEANLGPVDTLNPLYAVSNAERAASYLMFSRLMTYDTSGNINYDLARSVEVAQDGTEYTVELRDDVRWHDGRKLTAHDVAFTVGVLQDEATSTQFRGWSDIEVEVVGDYVLTFTLSSPHAAFEHALMFPILPEHILEGVAPSELREHDFSSNPVGSGVFEFRNNQVTDMTGSARIIHLAANETYYQGQPKLDRFQIHVYPDTDSIKQALRVNEVNAAIGLSGTEARGLGMDRYRVVANPVQTGVYALLNTDAGPLDDRNVRRALQLAADTEEIRERVGGSVSELYLPVTPNQVDGDLPSAPAHDPERADSILTEAGWELNSDGHRVDEDGERMQLSVVTAASGEYERALEALIGQWRRLGIEVNERIIDTSDPSQSFAQTVLQPRNYDVLVYQLEIGGDPDVYVYWHSRHATSSGLNLSNYSSAVVDDILSTGRVTLDNELRDAKYVELSQQFLRDVPAIGLYQQVSHYVHSGSSRGVLEDIQLVSAIDRYSNVHRWTVEEALVYKTP